MGISPGLGTSPGSGTSRLQSFSDGVIAVAITLLVLGIAVPKPVSHGDHRLAYQLGQLWPEFASYVTSFLTIGIIWINHHAMINRLRDADHTVLILNLLLLMSIGILPFATELMAAYLRQPHGQSVAAAIYSGSFLLMSIMFSALNRHILLGRHQMLTEQLSPQRRRQIYVRALAGLIPYVLATGLAAVSPYATLAICAAVALFYAHPAASGGQRPGVAQSQAPEPGE